ncbi:hypothetical protein FACS189411_14920 [Bacteroidia bacterium]|nr:hypothetical protein FACS189411_14920 [Bacteroidia bacterium]
MTKKNNIQIRNSTAEFLIFTNQVKGDGIEVRIQNNSVWLTQKLIATLFEVDRSVITKHLTNIYQEGELNKDATCAIFAQVQTEGNRTVSRDVEFYNLDAKNYLTETELESLGRIVNAYLDLAEDRAKRHIPMSMEDWAKRLDRFLEADDRDILQNSGAITSLSAKNFAESEFEKYRIKQDLLFESDFDREIKRIEGKQDSDSKSFS